jgi:lipopolysaccharide/colanic/teichoic acid biosynthesis glycosyltransferase
MLHHRRLILITGDIIALILSLGVMIYLGFNIATQADIVLLQTKLFIALFIVWLIVFFIFDLYNIRRVNPNPRNIGLLVAATITNTLLGLTFFYLTPQNSVSPKTNLVIVSIVSLILLFAWRRLFYHLFTVKFTRNIAIIGTSPLITHLIEELETHKQIGSIVYASDMLPTTLPSKRIDIIIAEQVDPQTLLAFSRAVEAEVLSLSDAYETLFGKLHLTLMSEEKALSYMNSSRNVGLHFVYRILEILFAVAVLIITSPFMLVAIIARIIEDGTPVFIKQTRVGKNGKLFYVYKLRSMKALSADGSAEQNGAQWAQQRDPRITPVGHIIRKTHMDEVPQMINIIKGDIALVGPRPERPEFVSELEQTIPYYFLRHSIRPGFTGWAQIKYRYARTTDDSREKFEYDLYYIKNQHPLLDVGIVLKTLQIIFTH